MRNVKCFSTYFIEVLKEARLAGQPSPGFRAFGGRWRDLLREPRRTHERLGDHLFPKSSPTIVGLTINPKLWSSLEAKLT
jgi:hypothetical protein